MRAFIAHIVTYCNNASIKVRTYVRSTVSQREFFFLIFPTLGIIYESSGLVALNEVKYTHSLIIDCIPANVATVVQDCLTYRNARDLQDYLTQGSAGYTCEIVVVKVAELISVYEH